MREVELKSVVDDVAERRARIESAGAKLVYSGRLLDRRYDFPDRSMALRDHVLRLRLYENEDGARTALDWKGETRYEHGYKVREEISTATRDAEGLAKILEMLGFIVIAEVDRQIFQYELGEATVRFEEYPLMDPLVEVEGTADAIESAISSLGLPRTGFTSERLTDFVARFEARTGQRAILSHGNAQATIESNR
jgi:predicted adenylyl cyclase CyaB